MNKKALFTRPGTDYLLRIYFREIRDSIPLEREAEIRLGERIKAGDREAVDILVQKNVRYVISVAKWYAENTEQLKELICEGNLGLILAAQKFDSSFSFRFVTYATWEIRQKIQNALKKNGTMWVPLNKTRTLKSISRRSLELEQILERKPTNMELSESLEMNEDVVAQCREYHGITISLDAPTHANEYYKNLRDPQCNIEERMLQDSDRLTLLALVRTLPRKEAEIMEYYFGLGQPHKTAAEIALLVNLSKERVRQIVAKADKELQRRGRKFFRKDRFHR